jgi:hypothetical protein
LANFGWLVFNLVREQINMCKLRILRKEYRASEAKAKELVDEQESAKKELKY